MSESKNGRFKGQFNCDVGRMIPIEKLNSICDQYRNMVVQKNRKSPIGCLNVRVPLEVDAHVVYTGYASDPLWLEAPPESIGLYDIAIYMYHYEGGRDRIKRELWGNNDGFAKLRDRILELVEPRLDSMAREDYSKGRSAVALKSDQMHMMNGYHFRNSDEIRKEGGMCAALINRTIALANRQQITNDYGVVEHDFAMNQKEKSRMEARPEFWRWIYSNSDLFGPPTYYIHFPEEDPSGRTKGLPDHQLRPEIEPVIGPHPDLYTDEEQMEWMINRATDEIKEQFETKAQ